MFRKPNTTKQKLTSIVGTYDSVARKKHGVKTQASLGLLPFSHIYGLVVVSYSNTHRGDSVIVLPKFEMKTFLSAVQNHKINQLYVVPPIIIQVIRNQDICSQYDLSSVRFLVTGAAPLGAETAEAITKLYPKWRVGQAYGECRRERYF